MIVVRLLLAICFSPFWLLISILMMAMHGYNYVVGKEELIQFYDQENNTDIEKETEELLCLADQEQSKGRGM